MTPTSLFSTYETPHFLQRRNPAVKLGLTLGYMLVATMLFDLWTLAAIAIFAFAMTWLLGRVPLGTLLRGMLPFLLLGLGYLWMNMLFPRAPDEVAQILFRLGPFRVVAEGVANGLALLARSLCFGACSLFFVTTTAPSDFVLSLIHQGRLSPRYAYAILAAYRFLPLFETELAQLRAAHRLRGVGEGEGLRGKLLQSYRYTLPLLAGAIRKADRVTLSMASRAFAGNHKRTYYRTLPIDRTDWLLALGALCALAAMLACSEQLGTLELWSGDLGY